MEMSYAALKKTVAEKDHNIVKTTANVECSTGSNSGTFGHYKAKKGFR